MSISGPSESNIFPANYLMLIYEKILKKNCNLSAISPCRKSSNPFCLAIISSLDTMAVKEDTADKTHKQP